MKAKYIGILSLLASGSIVGYIAGNHFSPDATKPETARHFLLLYGTWKRIDADHGRITLPAGSRVYQYTTGDAAVTVTQLPPSEMIHKKAPQRDMNQDFEKLAGLTVAQTGSASLLSTIMEGAAGTGTLASFSKGEKAGILLATGGSIGLGFWIGYHPQPDVSEPRFEETLTSEVATWKTDEAGWREEYDKVVAQRVAELERRRSLLGSSPAEAVFLLPIDSGPCAAAGLSGINLASRMAQGPLRSVHPEICDQVGSDPLVLAALSPAKAPASGLDSVLARILAQKTQPSPGVKVKSMPTIKMPPARP